jgi:hypothetical protein
MSDSNCQFTSVPSVLDQSDVLTALGYPIISLSSTMREGLVFFDDDNSIVIRWKGRKPHLPQQSIVHLVGSLLKIHP